MTQELTNLRAALVNRQINSTYAVSTDMFLEAIKQRTMLRTLADTLETNRNLAQIDKEKIEKSRIVLEGLEFFKVPKDLIVENFEGQNTGLSYLNRVHWWIPGRANRPHRLGEGLWVWRKQTQGFPLKIKAEGSIVSQKSKPEGGNNKINEWEK